jgi:pimeloyl-ACP methyl ester carboxylesterase
LTEYLLGYKTWNWKGYTINYVDLGRDSSVNKPPLLLVHGFGASLYHWRYNLPALSTKYHVFALDLLGFGLSDKVL